MLVPHLLDLARIDVGPAANDHFLLPPCDAEIAFLVEHAKVASAEPAVGGEASRIGVGIFVIPDSYRGTEGEDFADLVRRAIPTILVHDPDAHFRNRPSD